MKKEEGIALIEQASEALKLIGYSDKFIKRSSVRLRKIVYDRFPFKQLEELVVRAKQYMQIYRLVPPTVWSTYKQFDVKDAREILLLKEADKQLRQAWKGVVNYAA